jgi:isopentenyl diphosphate isomerase/L-lactate dehydrogenase-like FMN-dependent dehydrogenase
MNPRTAASKVIGETFAAPVIAHPTTGGAINAKNFSGNQ